IYIYNNTMRLYLLISVFLCFGMMADAMNPNIVVDVNTKRYLDTDGRERYFHGVNVVYKISPYAPGLEFDVYQSFGPQDMQYLQDWGLNVVRLGVMWAGVEPAQSVYNQTYLSYMRHLVDLMEGYGIYALLDGHQDLFSEAYCGDGAPAWAAKPKAKEAFPLPLAAPYPLDNVTHFPSREDCNKLGWADYYGTIACSGAFQSLYDNYEGIQDSYSGYWQQIATTFKTSTNVIGYELINEPWAGDVYTDPEILIPGVADRKYLQPLYDRLNTDIRSIDPDVCIDYDRLGCAGFLTEFGETSGNSPSVIESSTKIMNAVETYKQGWIFWSYKDFIPGDYESFFYNASGLPDPVRVKLFSRTYAQAVAGTTESTGFDSESGKFSITYTINPNCQLPTEIYLNEDIYYPNGYTVEIVPNMIANYTSTTNRIFIHHQLSIAEPVTISVY
ncbi:hypothetical protein SAMD00019534_123520, partial [Acytostelium subglobosum LB1]|uniref:hypothetical protein n=1 Tax=Acytostelium subglobosum LB1 TaxID=1410327 RepID=UPI000644F448